MLYGADERIFRFGPQHSRRILEERRVERPHSRGSRKQLGKNLIPHRFAKKQKYNNLKCFILFVIRNLKN
jgi:hypothetical protein